MDQTHARGSLKSRLWQYCRFIFTAACLMTGSSLAFWADQHFPAGGTAHLLVVLLGVAIATISAVKLDHMFSRSTQLSSWDFSLDDFFATLAEEWIWLVHYFIALCWEMIQRCLHRQDKQAQRSDDPPPTP